MMNFKKIILIFSSIIFVSLLNVYSQDTIYISEFMAINNNNLQDEDDDFSDWIEIHNGGTIARSLNGWALTDETGNKTKWIFPNITINAGEYLLVFASGKDRKLEKGKLHTNFKMGGSGEYLALVRPGGNSFASLFSPGYPLQYQNQSYGKEATGYIYFSIPTPGEINLAGIFVTPPEFSVSHGFYQTAFDLELQSLTEGADIYYTTDASTPDKTNGMKYVNPINISTTMVIRAIAVKDGIGESFTITRSYLFPNSIKLQSENQPGYPSTWLSPIHGTDNYFEIPSNYNMKQAFINRPEVSSVIENSLKSLPVVSIVSDIDNFFSKSTKPDSGGIYMYNGEPDGPTAGLKYHLGRGWSRLASVEYFNSDEDDGSIDFQSNCVVRIHGGATRTRAKTEKHSFKIGFVSESGPTKLNTQVFGKGSPKQYDWLILRGGFAPRLGQQIRDPWAKSTMREMGQYASYSKFVHVYINGIYWGMYNLSEQMDENTMQENLGGNAEDYDVLKDYCEVEAGDSSAWYKLVNMAADTIDSIAKPENYQKLLGNNPDGTPNPAYEKMINTENLIDYIMMNMYSGTEDWDYHNWVGARRKTDSEGFHFLVWDAEGVFQGSNISWIMSDGIELRPTGIFSDLMSNTQFRNQFISRVNKHFFEGGALTPKPCMARYQKWLGDIDTALISDQARWVASNDIWNTTFHSFIYRYFPPRTEAIFKTFITYDMYPVIDPPVFNTTDKILQHDFQLMMSSVTGGDIRYTLDGTDPGHFKLENTESIKIYDNQPVLLNNDTITINARVKMDTLWSKLVTKQFFVEGLSSFDALTADNKDNFLLYPNPVENYTQFEYSLSQPSHISIRICNMIGVEVASVINATGQEGKQTLNWNAESLAPGIYICIYENYSEGTTKSIRLIKR